MVCHMCLQARIVTGGPCYDHPDIFSLLGSPAFDCKSQQRRFNLLMCDLRVWGARLRARILGRPLGYLIFSLMALIGDHIYQHSFNGF